MRHSGVTGMMFGLLVRINQSNRGVKQKAFGHSSASSVAFSRDKKTTGDCSFWLVVLDLTTSAEAMPKFKAMAVMISSERIKLFSWIQQQNRWSEVGKCLNSSARAITSNSRYPSSTTQNCTMMGYGLQNKEPVKSYAVLCVQKPCNQIQMHYS